MVDVIKVASHQLLVGRRGIERTAYQEGKEVNARERPRTGFPNINILNPGSTVPSNFPGWSMVSHNARLRSSVLDDDDDDDGREVDVER